jgi:hypothetical protein
MSYGLGVTFFMNENYHEAFKLFIRSSNPNSYYYLGLFYEHGLCVKKDLWTARMYYELCVEENTIWKCRSAFHYASVNSRLYKKINEQIDLFFSHEDEYLFKYFIGYALIRGKFGSFTNFELGEKYFNEAQHKLDYFIIDETLVTYLYEMYYVKFSYFFNLLVLKKKINLDLIDYYFDIAISAGMVFGGLPIDESYKKRVYENCGIEINK